VRASDGTINTRRVDHGADDRIDEGMRTKEDQRRTLARIKRAEDAAHATITRAFDRVIQALQRERTEYAIRAARRQKPPRGGADDA
jgi:hypothetical protein